MHQLLRLLSIERGQLCRTILPSLQILAESLLINASALNDAVFQSLVGEPKTYKIGADWYWLCLHPSQMFFFEWLPTAVCSRKAALTFVEVFTPHLSLFVYSPKKQQGVS